MIDQVDVAAASEWLSADEAIIIDVREPAEYHEAHIDGAILMPLSCFNPSDIPVTNKKIIIQCKVGGRSMRACEIISAVDPTLPLYNLTGGILDWIQYGLPVKHG